jgi:hypothetical protein
MELTTQTGTAALRAVPMALYPTMDSLDSVVNFAVSQMPLTKNELFTMLMIYHNTMLKVMGVEEQPASETA